MVTTQGTLQPGLAPGRAGGRAEREPRRGATRDRIVVLLRRHGQLSASELAALVGVTRVAVRRHLGVLEQQGLVTRVRRAPGRGRPSLGYVLTDAGLESFPRHYDEVASEALSFLKSRDGAGLDAFLSWRNERLATEYAGRVRGATVEERANSLAELLSDQGFMAEVERADDGLRLCQHNCTVEHLASALPDLCASETELFERLLGAPVHRESTVVAGALRCVTRVEPRPEQLAVPQPPADTRSGTANRTRSLD